ncbi:hypothetical protein F5I97DRAFT_2074555 [Phlebopus sp. FC_14]|nr:hypothetical protein F5I97DRAFT_2074555 [Phlebopus sp. FC_14]
MAPAPHAALDVVIEALCGTADHPTLSLSLLSTISTAGLSSRPLSGPKVTYIYTSGTWVHGSSPTEFGKPGTRFALIHPDDLADVYLRVVEKAPILGGSCEYKYRVSCRSIGYKGSSQVVDPVESQPIRPILAKSLLDWQQKKPGLTKGLSVYYAAWKRRKKGRKRGRGCPRNSSRGRSELYSSISYVRHRNSADFKGLVPVSQQCEHCDCMTVRNVGEMTL